MENLPITFNQQDIPDDTQIPASEKEAASFGLSMSATAYSALAEGSTGTILAQANAEGAQPSRHYGSATAARLATVGYQEPTAAKLTQPEVDAKIKENGLKIKLNANQYTAEGIDSLITRAKKHEQMQRIDEATPMSYTGTPLRGAAMLGLSMLDPVNLVTGIFPAATAFRAVGLAKAAATTEAFALAGKTGATIGQRVAARAITGAIEGAVGNVPLELVTAPMRQDMGEDYTAMQSVANIAMGSVIGGGLHVVGGALGKVTKAIDSHIEAQPPEVKATLKTADNIPTPEAVKSFQDTQLKTILGDVNVDNIDVPLRNKLTEASLDVIPTAEDVSVHSPMEELRQAAEYQPDNFIANNLDDIPRPEIAALSDWVKSPLTSPRMVSQVMNEYNTRVAAMPVEERTGIQKANLLNEITAQVQPNAAELAVAVTPPTREAALNVATMQLEDDISPTVDSIIRSDQNIGTATPDNIKSELKSMTNPENSYVTRSIPEVEPIKEPLKFDDEIDYATDKLNLKAKAEEIERLSEMGLYSQKSKDTIKSEEPIVKNYDGKVSQLTDEMRKAFGKDADRLLESSRVKIVERVGDLGGSHPEGVQGMYRDGKVYLVAENLRPEAIKGVLLHEVGAHANMEKMLGAKGFNNLIKNVDRLMSENEQLGDLINAAIPADTPLQYRNEEKLAYMLEHMREFGFVKELIAKIRAWVYREFPSLQNSMKLTDADIAAMGVASLRNYARSAEVKKGMTPMYSQVQDIADTVQSELEEVNKVLSRMDEFKFTLTQVPELFDVGTKAEFIEMAKANSIPSAIADSLYYDAQTAYARGLEMSVSDPLQYASDFAVDKLEHGLYANKIALLHDKAQKKKITAYLQTEFAADPKAGIRSLLIGTMSQKKGARAFTTGDAINRNELLYSGQLDAGLRKLGIEDMVRKGELNDDMQKAMWAIDDGADLSQFSPEAIEASKLVMSIYDSINAKMGENGVVVNKLKHYLSNQQTLHNQTLILAAGKEKWKQSILQKLDIAKTAEAMNTTMDQVDSLLDGVYQGLSTGEHIGSQGSVSDFGNVMSKVTQKNRKLIFKDADSVIEYRKEFGDSDFASSIIGTIKGQARKLAFAQTLGVNYERNLKEIAKELENSIATPKLKEDFQGFQKDNGAMISMLESVDGRRDVPFSKAAARITSNITAIQSMAMLGSASVSSITDIANAASYLNRRGMGGATYNLVNQTIKQFTKFSPEKKQVLGSLGIFNSSYMQDVYRDGVIDNLDDKFSQFLSKKSRQFFKWSGLDLMTSSARLSSADSLMNYMSGFTGKEFDQLPKSLQRSLQLYNIDNEAWSVLNKTKQLQLDGTNYLMPQEIKNVRNLVVDKFTNEGLTGDVLEKATDRYVSRLEDNLIGFYHNGLSHMVIEPDAATKYYSTWQGSRPGSISGVLSRFMMQFKSYSIGYMRKVLGDVAYEEGATAGQKTWNLAKHVAASAVLGYIAMSLKDITKGKQPRSFFDEDGNVSGRTITAALLQGGGLGIAGDFLFGEANRFGGGALSTVAGPFIGNAASALDLTGTMKQGLFTGKVPDVKARMFNGVINNTPFVNMFYSRTALNYLFIYGLQEQLNPGYLNRMERRMQKENNQQFILPPSDYATQF